MDARVIEGDAPLGPFEEGLLAIGERKCRATARAGRNRRRPADHRGGGRAAADIGSERLRAPVLGLVDAQLIDPQRMGRAEYEREMETPFEYRREERRQRGHGYLRDAEAEIGWWAGYHDEPGQHGAAPPCRLPHHRARRAQGRAERPLPLAAAGASTRVPRRDVSAPCERS